MAIFMRVSGVDGESTVKGLEGFIELTGLEWRLSRSIEGARAGGQGIADTKVDQIRVTKTMDSSSARLMELLLKNVTDKKIEIRFVRTDTDGPKRYAFYELLKAGITDYVVSSSGSTPAETMLINFEEITFKVYKTGDDLKGVPDSVGYVTPKGRG